MLQMIFQNEYPMNDEYFHDVYTHYLYHNQIQHQGEKVIKNDTNEEWGFYVEIDPSTPPKDVFPKKNNHKHLAKAPSYHCEITQRKNVNYLHQIQEEGPDPNDHFVLDINLPEDYNNDKTYNDDYKEKISQNIFSGLTICALTTAYIYFYNKIRAS
jgi:hypothetical protein